MPAQPLARFAELVDPGADEAWRAEIRSTVEALRGRVVWHVNSTARGGGVAEMMGPLIGYARDAGADSRWMVIAGPPEFFAVTKRLHNRLHADGGDGGPLGAAEHRLYERVLRENATELAAVVRRGDVVVLHDPQTAGLAPSLSSRGAVVVWRCHIGHEDLGHPLVEEGWEFLRPSLEHADAIVFSRQAYVPAFCRDGRVAIVRPAIDPFSPKNQEMSSGCRARHPGALRSLEGAPDGSRLRFPARRRLPRPGGPRSDILRLGRAPDAEAPLVVQVSRWDRLKDHLGVMRGFAVSTRRRRRVRTWCSPGPR